jgi:predicted enzyme related to lactoylglutathione lyase
MDPVVHFEMPYEDKVRMTQFYQSVFGWQTRMLDEEMHNYVLATTTEIDETGPINPGAINGGFFPKRADRPGQFPSVIIRVEDMKKAMNNITKAGGIILGEPMNIPHIGLYLSFIDTEGNRVSILQPIPSTVSISELHSKLDSD